MGLPLRFRCKEFQQIKCSCGLRTKCKKRKIKVDKNGKEIYTYNVKNQLTGRKSENLQIILF